MQRLASIVAVLGAALLGSSAVAGTITVNADTSDPAPRAAWEAAIAKFQEENPDIEVEFNVYDHESYKKSIRNWLTSASPDVVFWYVGNRMQQFVEPGLLEDVSEVYTADVKGDMTKPHSISSLSMASSTACPTPITSGASTSATTSCRRPASMLRPRPSTNCSRPATP